MVGSIDFDAYPIEVEILGTAHIIDGECETPLYKMVLPEQEFESRSEIIRYLRKEHPNLTVQLQISHNVEDLAGTPKQLFQSREPFVDEFGFYVYYSYIVHPFKDLKDYRYD